MLNHLTLVSVGDESMITDPSPIIALAYSRYDHTSAAAYLMFESLIEHVPAQNLALLDVDATKLATMVTATPSIVAFKDCKVLGQMSGEITLANLLEFYTSIVNHQPPLPAASDTGATGGDYVVFNW